MSVDIMLTLTLLSSFAAFYNTIQISKMLQKMHEDLSHRGVK